MKVVLYSLLVSVSLSTLHGCPGAQPVTKKDVSNSSASATASPFASPVIVEEAATNIAKSDFIRLRGSHEDFVVDKSEQEDAWRIVIRLKRDNLVGIGVVYMVDKRTGKISEREFYQ